MALGIRKRLHSQAQPVRKAFLDWHFGPDRATQVNEALDNDKNLLQPRVAPDVVVLHIDIRGSTDLGVNLKAAGQSAFYVGFIDAYHNASYEEAFQRCGVVDKTMGDGVQLLFNVFSPATLNLPPFPGTINAKRQAIETTLAIFRRFREILVERRKSEKWDYQPDLSLGAGLVAGEAYVGSFAGVDMAGLDFTVLGAPPNAAGKLVGEARPGVLADWIDTGVKQQYIPLALNTGAEVAMDQVAKLCERLRGEPPVSVLLAGLDFCDAAKGFRDCYQVRCPRSKKPYVLIVA
jgi:class 3 adenylate cyclase